MKIVVKQADIVGDLVRAFKMDFVNPGSLHLIKCWAVLNHYQTSNVSENFQNIVEEITHDGIDMAHHQRSEREALELCNDLLQIHIAYNKHFAKRTQVLITNELSVKKVASELGLAVSAFEDNEHLVPNSQVVEFVKGYEAPLELRPNNRRVVMIRGIGDVSIDYGPVFLYPISGGGNLYYEIIPTESFNIKV